MITGDKRETLERWLFNYAEPPYEETSEELAREYEDNLRELHQAESPTEWRVENLICTPDEICEVIEERLVWLEKKEAR